MLRENQLIGKTSYEIFDEKIADYHTSCDEEAINLKVPLTVRDACRSSAGELFHLITTRVPIIHFDKVVGLMGLAADVTMENEIKDKIKESIVRLESMLDENILVD